MEIDYQHMSSSMHTWFETPRGRFVKGEVVATDTEASARGGFMEIMTVEYEDQRFTIERPVRDQ